MYKQDAEQKTEHVKNFQKLEGNKQANQDPMCKSSRWKQRNELL